jgi:eukaryotic-like serine/threonine-protein kinase
MPKSGILTAGTRALGYDIITLINSGQFGEVYEVFDRSVGRRSALKLIEVTDPAAHKAVVEAQAQYLCSHSNVVQIFTADELSAGQTSYVAIEMEFIPEGSLENRIQSGFVSCKQAVHHIKQVLFALEHAHNRDIVHRDVKPGNILLARPNTKLSDFGTVIFPATGKKVVDLFYVPMRRLRL